MGRRTHGSKAETQMTMSILQESPCCFSFKKSYLLRKRQSVWKRALRSLIFEVSPKPISLIMIILEVSAAACSWKGSSQRSALGICRNLWYIVVWFLCVCVVDLLSLHIPPCAPADAQELMLLSRLHHALLTSLPTCDTYRSQYFSTWIGVGQSKDTQLWVYFKGEYMIFNSFFSSKHIKLQDQGIGVTLHCALLSQTCSRSPQTNLQVESCTSPVELQIALNAFHCSWKNF